MTRQAISRLGWNFVAVPPPSTNEKDELKDSDAHLQGANAPTARRGWARRQNANMRDMLRSINSPPPETWIFTDRCGPLGRTLVYNGAARLARASRLVRRCSSAIHRDG